MVPWMSVSQMVVGGRQPLEPWHNETGHGRSTLCLRLRGICISLSGSEDSAGEN